DEVRERITLTLEIAVGAQDLGDEVQISGVPDLAVMVPGGFPGDLATAAVVVNSVVQVAAARPGLLTMLDLPPPRVGVSINQAPVPGPGPGRAAAPEWGSAR